MSTYERIVATYRCMTKSHLNHGDIPGRTPTLRDQGLSPNVVVEQIESFVDGLLLSHHVLPASQILSNLQQLGPPCRASVVKNHFEVFNTPIDLTKRLDSLVSIGINGVKGSTHGLRDLADLGEQGISVSKDNEDILASLRTSDGVDKWFGDVGVVHVKVTAKNAPEHALKCG